MLKHNQNGAVNSLVLSLVLCVLFLFGALGFGGWAYMSRQDYKNNTDQKVSAAVEIAKQKEATAKDAEFVQAEKKPLRTYNGPSEYGSIVMSFPKTWSGYVSVNSTNTTSNQIDGYFYPNVVPSISSPASLFAVRIQVVGQPYDQVLATITNQLKSSGNSVPPTYTPYALPKVPKAIGVKMVGTLPDQKQGEMVILPLRSQTIKIWTESDQFKADFENNILPNFSFVP
jgi:hypothetical protein